MRTPKRDRSVEGASDICEAQLSGKIFSIFSLKTRAIAKAIGRLRVVALAARGEQARRPFAESPDQCSVSA
jgi:hypothetical protein